MSLIVKLIIFGWMATFAMIGGCALYESGKLLSIRKRIASWLAPSASPTVTFEDTLRSEDGDVVA
jgi:hypothetical protein